MEPFKNYFNHELVGKTADIFDRAFKGFDRQRFTELATFGLEELELKERATQIMLALDTTLPASFDELEHVVLSSLHESEDPSGEGLTFDGTGLMGFAAWPVTDLVTHRGIHHPEKALPLLKEVTKRFTAEFAIRPFLVEHRDYTLSVLNGWVDDQSRHVRRLVSEGTRPRLPWGLRLNEFVADPAPILPLLKALRDDEEDYVRRSVANSLNDIAKDHPDMVAEIAHDWLVGASAQRSRLVRHACRTLLKAGDENTLAAFGYKAIEGLTCELSVSTPEVAFGNALEFGVSIGAPDKAAPVMVDYAIHFVKSSGATAPKVFKWKDAKLKNGCLKAERSHAIKPITTRRYYEGRHKLEIFVNGVSVAIADFELRL